MATETIKSRFDNARTMAYTIPQYKKYPERLYNAFTFLLIPKESTYKQVEPMYKQITGESLDKVYIDRRLEFAQYIIDNRRVDIILEIFSEDDYYLDKTLKILAKFGLNVDINTVEEVDV